MKFTKYNSLTNHTQTKFKEKVLMEGLSEGLFIGTEKAHGANFSFYFDGSELRTAKRSGFNGADEHFYGSQELIENYAKNVRALYLYLLRTQSDLGFAFDLVIRGEVIGGNYKGESTPQAKQVQKEVQYCPNNEFIAFDIEINGYTVSYETFKGLCDKHEIPTCPEIASGTLVECLEANNDFDSLIPGVFGRENFEGNTTEGIVIRPVDGERYLSNGTRVIIKSKNDKFKENGTAKTKVKTALNLTDAEKELGESLTTYFSENRISNLFSKYEEVTSWKEFPKFGGLFFQDALEDFDKDTDGDLKETLGDNWKAFVRVYKSVSDKMLREVFVSKL